MTAAKNKDPSNYKIIHVYVCFMWVNGKNGCVTGVREVPGVLRGMDGEGMPERAREAAGEGMIMPWVLGLGSRFIPGIAPPALKHNQGQNAP